MGAYRNDPVLRSILRAALVPFSILRRPMRSVRPPTWRTDPGSSYAGQFATLLDVRGVDGVADAIATVWDSAHAEAVREYARRKGQPDQQVRMGVIMQRMVTPSYSGVAFSRNPMTGLQRDGGRGRVRTRRRTGTAGGDAGALGEPLGRLDCPPGESAMSRERVIREVADGARRIEKRLRTPVDLEWVHDGEHLSGFRRGGSLPSSNLTSTPV